VRIVEELMEIWLNKVCDNSSTIEVFMDRKIAARHGFKLQKLESLIQVRNVDGTNNSARAIIY